MAIKRPVTVDQMIDRFLNTKTHADTALKTAAMKSAAETAGGQLSGGDLPEALKSWVDKVARNAYKTTAEDVAAMRAAGYTEDQVLEITIGAALGASVARMDAGLRALHRED